MDRGWRQRQDLEQTPSAPCPCLGPLGVDPPSECLNACAPLSDIRMESQALRSLEFWSDFFLQSQQTQGTCALWAQLCPCLRLPAEAGTSQQFSKREGLCGEEGSDGSRGKDVITTSWYSLN